MCTTNAVESVNAHIRKAVKARGHIPNEQAALKGVYLAVMALDPTGKASSDERGGPNAGNQALNAFHLRWAPLRAPPLTDNYNPDTPLD